MVELRHLRTFVAVAESRHFRKAAEQLNTSQSAVSKAIFQLEAAVGTLLFLRSTRSVDMTPAGQELLTAAHDILARVERAMEDANRAATGFRGRLTIGYMDIAIIGRLPELISRFSEHHPDIHIDLTYSWTDRQQMAVLTGELDVGFIHGDAGAADFARLLFSQEGFVAVLSDRHPLAKRTSLPLAELSDDRFVFGVREEWRPLVDQVRRMCVQAGFEPRVVQEAHFRDALFGFVAADLGVTVYPASAANTPRRGVCLVPLEEPLELVDVFMIWNRQSANPVLPTFVDFVRSQPGLPSQP